MWSSLAGNRLAVVAHWPSQPPLQSSDIRRGGSCNNRTPVRGPSHGCRNLEKRNRPVPSELARTTTTITGRTARKGSLPSAARCRCSPRDACSRCDLGELSHNQELAGRAMISNYIYSGVPLPDSDLPSEAE